MQEGKVNRRQRREETKANKLGRGAKLGSIRREERKRKKSRMKRRK